MEDEFDKTVRRTGTLLRESYQRANGAEILLVNWQNATAPEVRLSMDAVKAMLTSRTTKTLVLFDVGGMRWDAKLPFEAVPWMKEMVPFTARVAITGIAGLQLSVLTGLRSLTRLRLPVFDTRGEATAWLTRPRNGTGPGPLV